MQDLECLVRQILMAGDGEIVGRIRFQKIAYFLEQKGLRASLNFTYHHYGPYCRDLSEALDWQVILDEVEEEHKAVTNGGTYSILRLKQPAGEKQPLGRLHPDQARRLVRSLKKEPSVVLELAATVHWLQHGERVDDWRQELKMRKNRKATDSNIDRALTVLTGLGLL